MSGKTLLSNLAAIEARQRKNQDVEVLWEQKCSFTVQVILCMVAVVIVSLGGVAQ